MDKIPYIFLIFPIIALISSFFFKKTSVFKNNYEEKIDAYQNFTEACSDAITRHTSKTYKDLNSRAIEIMPFIYSAAAKEMVQRIADMTGKQSRHSLNRTELRDICKVCISALRDDLYHKPQKKYEKSK